MKTDLIQARIDGSTMYDIFQVIKKRFESKYDSVKVKFNASGKYSGNVIIETGSISSDKEKEIIEEFKGIASHYVMCRLTKAKIK